MNGIADWANLAGAVESAATVVAIALGGWWTYRTFLRQRLGHPRLRAEILPQLIAIPTGHLIRCSVRVENIGSVVARCEHGEVRCRQLLPMPPRILEAAAGGFDPVAEDAQVIDWPVLAQRQWRWKGQTFEIEPGETDSLAAEFFVPREARVLEIYFYLANAKKSRRGLGWPCSKIIELDPPEEKVKDETIKMVPPKDSYIPLQQKRQEHQPQQQRQPPQQQEQSKGKSDKK